MSCIHIHNKATTEQHVHSWFLAPMASCRGTCRCMPLNLIMTVRFDGLFFQFLASHSLCSSFNFHCCLCRGMFMTRCNENNDVQSGHFSVQNGLLVKGKGKGILFNVGGQTGKDCLLTHFKEKQSFSLVNSSSLGWVIVKRESSSKVQRGARMPRQCRAGKLVLYIKNKSMQRLISLHYGALARRIPSLRLCVLYKIVSQSVCQCCTVDRWLMTGDYCVEWCKT